MTIKLKGGVVPTPKTFMSRRRLRQAAQEQENTNAEPPEDPVDLGRI